MENIRDIIEKQRMFVKKGLAKDYSYRIKSLKVLKKTIEKYEQEIYIALKKDLGKSSEESYITEYKMVINEIDFLIKNLKELMKPQKVNTPLITFRSKGEIYYEPYGHVLIISPWNYPFQLALLPLAGAIAAGNTILIKPSEFSENTSELLESIINDAFSQEYVALDQGAVPETSFILEMKFDYIFFTGSTQVGKIVMKAAAEHLTPLTLELGGKSPAIVCKDSDLEVSARRIVWGKFTNAGQTCIAPDYLYVHKDIKEELIRNIIKSIREFYGEYPKKSLDYGRIISEKHLKRLVEFLKDGNLVFGGNFDYSERYFGPTILEAVDWNTSVMKEEIFGPILPILEFESLEKVAEIVKERAKPLALYLFTKDTKNIDYILNEVSFGGGCINDTILHLSSEELPFGGVGESGMGRYHGKFSFETFSHQKSVLTKTFKPDFDLRYPPYAKNMGKLKKMI
jgi:aldehyde dehydrogenase (NAD+)